MSESIPMAYLFTSGKFQAFDSSGNPLASGKVYTYAAGTTTPLASYTTQAGSVANANPVILDSAGRADIWLGAYSYRILVKDALGVTVYDSDNIRPTGISQVMAADIAITTEVIRLEFPASHFTADEPVVLVTVRGGGATEVDWTCVAEEVAGMGEVHNHVELTFPTALIGSRASVWVVEV